jgi:hypothetical protein
LGFRLVSALVDPDFADLVIGDVFAAEFAKIRTLVVRLVSKEGGNEETERDRRREAETHKFTAFPCVHHAEKHVMLAFLYRERTKVGAKVVERWMWTRVRPPPADK